MYRMIVDTHTHVWQSPDQLGPQMSAALRARALAPTEEVDASPVAHEQATDLADVAFVLGLRSVHLETLVPDELISRYVASRPDRLLGFAGIDPMEADLDDRLASLTSLKLSGAVIAPADQNFHPMHTRAVALYEKLAELDMPLIVHTPDLPTRDSAMSFGQPVLLDDVARQFPTLRILVTRCGHPFADQTLALIGKHPNVYTEISGVSARPWQLFNMLLTANEMGVTEKLLFGSGYPHHDPAAMVERLYSINRFATGSDLPTVPRERLRAIVERDALSALNLKRRGSRIDTNTPTRRPATANEPVPHEPTTADTGAGDTP